MFCMFESDYGFKFLEMKSYMCTLIVKFQLPDFQDCRDFHLLEIVLWDRTLILNLNHYTAHFHSSL